MIKNLIMSFILSFNIVFAFSVTEILKDKKFSQIFLDKNNLYLVDNKNQLLLFQNDNLQKLADGFNQNYKINAGFGRVSGANLNGFYIVYQNNKIYVSNFKPSPHSSAIQLRFGTIINLKDGNSNYVARIGYDQKPFIESIRKDFKILSDSSPLAINFNSPFNDDSNLQVAILGDPSTHYPHGALGDDEEATSLYFLERHNLKDLAKPLILDSNSVFEGNSLLKINFKNKQIIATVTSSRHSGANLALVDNINDNLQIIANAPSVGIFRWLSPFSINQKLYAIVTPHLSGNLTQFDIKKDKIEGHIISSGFSNHTFGSRDTNISANLLGNLLIPNISYNEIHLINLEKNTNKFKKLGSKIKQLVAYENIAYLLTLNGQLYKIEP